MSNFLNDSKMKTGTLGLFLLIALAFSAGTQAQKARPSELHVVKQKGHWGYIDKLGKLVISLPPRVLEAADFSEEIGRASCRERVCVPV